MKLFLEVRKIEQTKNRLGVNMDYKEELSLNDVYVNLNYRIPFESIGLYLKRNNQKGLQEMLISELTRAVPVTINTFLKAIEEQTGFKTEKIEIEE